MEITIWLMCQFLELRKGHFVVRDIFPYDISIIHRRSSGKVPIYFVLERWLSLFILFFKFQFNDNEYCFVMFFVTVYVILNNIQFLLVISFIY